MSDLRKEFEKTEARFSLCEFIYFDENRNQYETKDANFNGHVTWLNGAWYAFQERQKKIDDVLKHIRHEEWMDEYGDYQCPVQRIRELLK